MRFRAKMLAVNFAPKQIRQIRRKLLAWHGAHRRDLPWRRSRDPYRVWLAEIMLQQTRISAVIPYYERFLKRFPSIRLLARAPELEVLKLWAGLGYYSRARNLHRAAKEIIRRHAGKFPRDVADARALPGIGSYTAAAILSIAYDVPLAALDGNVARVLARLLAVRGDIRVPKNKKRLAAAAELLLPIRSPGTWNEAVMELGQTICTPRAPRCGICPLRRECKGFALGIAEKLPATSKKPGQVSQRIAAAILLDSKNRTLLTRNHGAHDAVLFSRLCQFPAIEVQSGTDATQALARHLRSTLGVDSLQFIPLPRASHSVTFRKIALLPYLAHVRHLPAAPGCRRLPLAGLNGIPISSATRKIARAAQIAIAT